MMSLTQLSLHQLALGPSGQGSALGSRARAVGLRRQVEAALEEGSKVVLDFDGVQATQSFVDELIGVVVLERGPDVLRQVSFKRCSTDMKAIVSFVVSDRAKQHLASLA
ncbi:STAS-like domain-containing protein [Variovorax sp. PBL-H6]|uniref:STAS-like domain-containing protein n=1 Tax=Variovorax sp. PBL-H6 TaxID=434009 RepID=UPI0013A59719|nr:STAS-like domain-containing protein [Variovorax sp. PBL-H6]